MTIIRHRIQSPDPSGRLQVVECADDATGVRVYVVYGPENASLGLCATREQAFVFVQQLVTESALRDGPPLGAAS